MLRENFLCEQPERVNEGIWCKREYGINLELPCSFRITMSSKLLFVFLALTTATAGREELLRLHYGTIFRNLGRLPMFDETWVHTFAIVLPNTDNPSLPETVGNLCPANRTEGSSTCLNAQIVYYEVVKFMEQQRMTTVNNIIDVLTTARNIIPEIRNETARFRERRAWLPFVGDLVSTVTGVATEKE